MAEETMRVCEALDVAAEMALAYGAEAISNLPGCWEMQIDDSWWIAINGHGDKTACSKGASVLPYSAYVEFNGLPAGVFDPGGGCIAAGSLANENTLITAMKAAIARAPAKP